MDLLRREFLLRSLSGCALCGVGAPVLARDSQLPPFLAPLEPLVTAGYQPSDTDERGMWHECERLEKDIAASNLLLRDEALNGYVRSITERLIRHHTADVRIYLVRDPDFNAAMFPNGMMLVHTGLMARVRNEAQLASVIGHECGHYLRRHSVERWRDLRRKANVAAVLSLAGAVAGAQTGGGWYDLATVISNALILSVLSFSRVQESEADAYGLQLLANAGYTPRAAGDTWAQFIEERKASAAVRKKKYRDRSASVLSTHPPTQDRMDVLTSRAVIAEANAAGPLDDRKDEWVEAIVGVRGMLIDEQVKLNDPGGNLYLVESLARDGWDGLLRYYEGEVYRLRGEKGDAALATAAYSSAVTYEDAPAEAHRAYGYAQLKAGNVEEGRRALARYLEMRPAAPDAEMVRFSLGT